MVRPPSGHRDRHRKRLGLRGVNEASSHSGRRRPSLSSVAMGALFMVGSFCFGIGCLPAYADHVAVSTVAWTFFVGSIFFTSAAALQYHEAATAPPGPGDRSIVLRGFRRFASVKPHRIDWWASSVQFGGTILFNISTFAAIGTGLSVAQARRWVWSPDVFGSVAFLVASWLAYAEVASSERGVRQRSLGWWIAMLNLLGSVAFGVSAIAARYVHSTGEIANISLVNLATFLGALGFFVGAALLPVESARGSSASVPPD